MPIETSYTHVRQHLASFLDRVVQDREVVFIRRKGARDVALIPAEELSSLMETAHLLRSPANAVRLLKALGRAKSGRGKPESLDKLRRDVGMDSGR